MRIGQQGYVRTVKRLLICDIVDQEDAHGTSVVRRRNGTETLLSGGIPLRRDNMSTIVQNRMRGLTI